MQKMQMEQRLWEYIDGTCTEVGRIEIEMLLKTNAAWKSGYDELVRVHMLLRTAELEQPSLRFIQNVMEQVAKEHISPATKTYLNKKVIYGIAIFFMTMIAGLLVFGPSQGDWSGTTARGISFDVNEIQWNQVFTSSYANIFMMMNVVLALVLVDKFLVRRKRLRG